MGKLKKQDNFLLSRKIRKECATEFMTLADYVISRKKNKRKGAKWYFMQQPFKGVR